MGISNPANSTILPPEVLHNALNAVLFIGRFFHFSETPKIVKTGHVK
jgi:hypothetical protein